MTGRYSFVPSESRFTVQAFATGMLSMMAHNPTLAIRGFKGEIEFSPETLEKAALAITVRADSLELTDKVSPKDLAEIESRMREEVLETARYPEIAFRSTEATAVPGADYLYRLRIQGELRLHGVTASLPVDAELTQFTDGVRLQGGFSLLLSTYNLKRVSALGGLIRLKDDLRFAFDLIGRPND